ncbi:unnamed protein product, partial [Rotaria sp. Silwood1]
YGNGSFQLPITYSTGYDSSPYFVIIADFNRDSWLDIAIAYAGIGSVGVFLGYHNGSLASAKTYSTGSTSVPYAIGIGDFNHDTNLDLAVANSDADEIVIVLGYGNGIEEPIEKDIWSANVPLPNPRISAILCVPTLATTISDRLSLLKSPIEIEYGKDP